MADIEPEVEIPLRVRRPRTAVIH